MIDQETGEIIEHQPPFIRTPYNYNMNKASDETGLYCADPSLAQQHDKDDADINTLVRKFGITGQLPMLERIPLAPDEFVDITDFHGAMNAVKTGQDTFMQMPADIRKRFNNDPHEFLAFVHNDSNREEAQKLGIIKTPEPPALEVGAPPPTPPVAS